MSYPEEHRLYRPALMTTPALELSSARHGESVVVTFAGELDISSTARVENELARVEEGAPPVIVLDLSALDFMDSTGLRLVVGADHRARARGGRLAVVRGREAVQRIFRITRLEDRLDMVASADEAVAAPS
jgi:anti-sigma B factor antagonist